ncbi:LOW QUALITY PROTEIN: zinc finger matrin-type protein 3-like [Xyrauchen texanus]|uniref:LOW QUALITY PROTEIN: zinc finger matrin-type protein 3-like n=1 Tax=Xyrauchen texanus TaxID=154827 RepID=UPI0022419C03|nr:LOW QUALITY PROTEIN: zinc finger matrin-type protein 3-like [Xyrauchen texanus]
MAMNVKNRDAFYSSADYCNIYSSQPVNYGDCSHYFPRMAGPDAVLKPPISLMCQQHPQHFQVMTPAQNLSPPPVMMSPDPLRFPLCTALAVKPSHHLQMPSIPAPPVVSPKPPEEDGPAECGDQEAALEELCRPLYCKLCNVTLNSTQQAQAHYQGKNHSKKLRNFYAGSDQPPPVRLAEVEPVSQQPSDSAHVTAKQHFSASRIILATENDYCKMCDASFSSPAVAQAHYQGKNHAKRLRLAEAQQNATSSDLCEPQRWPRKEGYENRLMKNRRAMPGPYYNPRPRQRIPRDLAMCVTPSGQFYCSMCNSGASEEAEFRLHLESKPHKSRVSEQRYRSEMEHLGYT